MTALVHVFIVIGNIPPIVVQGNIYSGSPGFDVFNLEFSGVHVNMGHCTFPPFGFVVGPVGVDFVEEEVTGVVNEVV